MLHERCALFFCVRMRTKTFYKQRTEKSKPVTRLGRKTSGLYNVQALGRNRKFFLQNTQQYQGGDGEMQTSIKQSVKKMVRYWLAMAAGLILMLPWAAAAGPASEKVAGIRLEDENIPTLSVSLDSIEAATATVPRGSFLWAGEANGNGITINYKNQPAINITTLQPYSYTMSALSHDILKIDLSINGIIDDTATNTHIVQLDCVITLLYPYQEELFNSVLPVPFGKIGFLRSPLLTAQFVNADETNDIDVSILSGNLHLKYDISVNLSNLTSPPLADTANLIRMTGAASFIHHDTIQEEVIVNSADENQTTKYDVAIIPLFNITRLFTILGTTVKVYQGDTLVYTLPNDIPTVGQYIKMLPIPLPKGYYHFWFKLGV